MYTFKNCYFALFNNVKVKYIFFKNSTMIKETLPKRIHLQVSLPLSQIRPPLHIPPPPPPPHTHTHTHTQTHTNTPHTHRHTQTHKDTH